MVSHCIVLHQEVRAAGDEVHLVMVLRLSGAVVEELRTYPDPAAEALRRLTDRHALPQTSESDAAAV